MPCCPLLLQAVGPSVLISDQGVLIFVGFILSGFCALMVMLSRFGERIARIEIVQEIYIRSAERNRPEVVTPNPMKPMEEAILNVVVNEGGDHVTVGELEIATAAVYRESIDEKLPVWEREKYKTLLPVLDARLALKRYEQERKALPGWRRFLEGLR